MISADLEGLILRMDWLVEQGTIDWDMPNSQVRIGASSWLDTRMDEPSVRIRRLIAIEDTVIPAHGHVVINAHMLCNRWHCREPHTRFSIMERQPVSRLEHVYSVRMLRSMQLTELEVLLLTPDPRTRLSLKELCWARLLKPQLCNRTATTGYEQKIRYQQRKKRLSRKWWRSCQKNLPMIKDIKSELYFCNNEPSSLWETTI